MVLCFDDDGPYQIGDLHEHDFYEIQYVFSGEGMQILNGRSYKISTGSIVLLSPNAVHTYYYISNLSIVNVCFNPSQIQKKKNRIC